MRKNFPFRFNFYLILYKFQEKKIEKKVKNGNEKHFSRITVFIFLNIIYYYVYPNHH